MLNRSFGRVIVEAPPLAALDWVTQLAVQRGSAEILVTPPLTTSSTPVLNKHSLQQSPKRIKLILPINHVFPVLHFAYHKTHY